MFVEYIGKVKKIGTINIFIKLLNLLKIILIGNILGFSYESERFFILCGLIYPVYYIVESVVQAYLIPLIRNEDKRFSNFITLKYIKNIFFISIFSALFLCFLNIFKKEEKIFVFLLTFFLLNSALYKIILECKLRFVKNALIDLLCSAVFIVLFFIFNEYLIGILIFIEFARGLIKLLIICYDIYPFYTKDIFYEEDHRDLLYITAGSAFSNIRGFIDTYFVSFFDYGAIVLNIGASIPSAIIQFINSIFSGVSLGYFTDKWFDEFEKRRKVYDYFLIPILVFCGICFYFSDFIMETFFYLKKDQFSDNADISLMLSAYSLLIPFFYLKIITIRFLNARKKNLFLMKISFFTLIIYLIMLNFIFGNIVTGVAFSRIIADISFVLIVLLLTEEKIALYWYIKKVLQISFVFITLYLLFKRKGVF